MMTWCRRYTFGYAKENVSWGLLTYSCQAYIRYEPTIWPPGSMRRWVVFLKVIYIYVGYKVNK